MTLQPSRLGVPAPGRPYAECSEQAQPAQILLGHVLTELSTPI